MEKVKEVPVLVPVPAQKTADEPPNDVPQEPVNQSPDINQGTAESETTNSDR